MSEEIRSIGIIGEGKMGTNIFNYLMDFEFILTWVTSKNADLEKLERNFRKKLKRSLDAGIMEPSHHDHLAESTKISVSFADLALCDLVIEAVPEDLMLKTGIFRELDTILKPSAILVSNSSSIIPSKLIPSQKRRDKTIGLHFFYPVSLKNITEIMVTKYTSDETISQTIAFLDRIRKNYLLLPEENGFILNKIFLAFQNEAFLMVSEGKASFSQMDEIVKNRFFPFGVFDFMENVGLLTMVSSVKNYTEGGRDRESCQRLISFLDEMVCNGISSFPEPSLVNGISEDQCNFEIIPRLTRSLKDSIFGFLKGSQIRDEQLFPALNEYFVTNIRQILD